MTKTFCNFPIGKILEEFAGWLNYGTVASRMEILDEFSEKTEVTGCILAWDEPANLLMRNLLKFKF